MYENTKNTIKEIRKTLQKISKLTDNAAFVTDREFPQTEMNDLSLELERQTEKLALLGRALPLDLGDPEIRMRSVQIPAEAMDIRIGYTQEGWFLLEIPALLPKKSKAGNVNYIRGPLLGALSGYFRKHPHERFGPSVIAYRHVYDRSLPERRRRDHDNIEVNFVTDAVALFTLPDDSPAWCSHYYCSAAGDANRTQVFVVPQTDFTRWLRLYGDDGVESNQSIPHEQHRKEAVLC